jgi:hypothetical protein
MEIVRTLIQDGFVELTLSDAKTLDELSEHIEIRLRVEVAYNHLIAEVHQAALRRARDAIGEEIRRLASLEGRKGASA